MSSRGAGLRGCALRRALLAGRGAEVLRGARRTAARLLERAQPPAQLVHLALHLVDFGTRGHLVNFAEGLGYFALLQTAFGAERVNRRCASRNSACGAFRSAYRWRP